MLLSIKIITTPHINFPQTTIDNPIYRCFIIIFIQPPIFGKVITNTIRNDSKSDICLILHHRSHNTVNSIIARSVSTYNHNGSITIISQGTGESFHRPKTFGLYVVKNHLTVFHIATYLIPTLLSLTASGFRIINNPPSVWFYSHNI